MAERPLECGECKKPIAVCYTEIVGDKMTRTVMCADCPVLEKRLYGKLHKESLESGEEVEKRVKLTCAHCGTSLEAVQTGNPLGCSECYEVFGNILIEDLLKAGKISKHLTSNKQTMPLHIGRTPGEITEINPTLKLIALNEALDETLIKEDYETAALLRDQIRAIKERMKPDEKK